MLARASKVVTRHVLKKRNDFHTLISSFYFFCPVYVLIITIFFVPLYFLSSALRPLNFVFFNLIHSSYVEIV